MEFEHIARSIANGLQDAWNAGDATGFADYFAEDADFIHILGGHGRGRMAIAAAHEALFSGVYRDSNVRLAVADVRPLGPDAIIAMLTQRLDFGAKGSKHSMTCRPTLVVERQGNDWRIVLLQNTRLVETTDTALDRHPFAPSALEVGA